MSENGNGNGNGTSKLVSILPTVLAVIVTVFFGVAAMLTQAMSLRSEISDLRLQLAVAKNDCETRILTLQREHDAVRIEVLEDRINKMVDPEGKKKEP